MPSLHQSVPQLRRRRLGVIILAFFTVAASAPLTVPGGVVATTPAAPSTRASRSRSSSWRRPWRCSPWGYVAMSRHVSNAGPFYAYLAKGLGRVWGVAGALVALIGYNTIQISLYGLFGAGFADSPHEPRQRPPVVGVGRASCSSAPSAYSGSTQRPGAGRPAHPWRSSSSCCSTWARSPTPPAASSVPPPLAPGSCSVRASVACSPRHRRVHRLRVRRGLQRGGPQPAGDRRPRDVRGGGLHRHLLRAVVLGAGRGRRPGEPAGRGDRNGPAWCSACSSSTGARWSPTSRTCCSSPASSPPCSSFHNGVARTCSPSARDDVLPPGLGRVGTRAGGPRWVAHPVRLALVVRRLRRRRPRPGRHPVHTGCSAVAAIGVMTLMVLTSFAVIGFFRKRDNLGQPAPGSGLSPPEQPPSSCSLSCC